MRGLELGNGVDLTHFGRFNRVPLTYSKDDTIALGFHRSHSPPNPRQL